MSPRDLAAEIERLIEERRTKLGGAVKLNRVLRANAPLIVAALRLAEMVDDMEARDDTSDESVATADAMLTAYRRARRPLTKEGTK